MREASYRSKVERGGEVLALVVLLENICPERRRDEKRPCEELYDAEVDHVCYPRVVLMTTNRTVARDGHRSEAL